MLRHCKRVDGEWTACCTESRSVYNNVTLSLLCQWYCPRDGCVTHYDLWSWPTRQATCRASCRPTPAAAPATRRGSSRCCPDSESTSPSTISPCSPTPAATRSRPILLPPAEVTSWVVRGRPSRSRGCVESMRRCTRQTERERWRYAAGNCVSDLLTSLWVTWPRSDSMRLSPASVTPPWRHTSRSCSNMKVRNFAFSPSLLLYHFNTLIACCHRYVVDLF